MTLLEYYEDLKQREKDFPAELYAGWDAIIFDLEKILGVNNA